MKRSKKDLMTRPDSRTVTAAVLTRFSCRAFLDRPVPGEVVREMLAIAARAPSGGNLQPWRVHARAGEPLRRLLADVAQKLEQHPRGERWAYPVYPENLPEPWRTRRFRVGEQLYAAIGVPREDRAGRLTQYARNYALFGAPVALFVTTDAIMGPPQWADLGIFLQTLMLLARERGLDTCAQEAWAAFPDTLAAHLAFRPGETIFCGLALGHADETAPINAWRAERETLEGFATMEGFA
jgi:nitroreductase